VSPHRAAKLASSVLIVEDDPDIRELLGAFLELHGCTALLACEGREALEMLRRGASLPSFVLLDLTMPGMNGAEFRAAQAEDPRLSGIPVVVVSADPDIRREAERLGATAFLKKPIETDALLRLVRRFRPRGDRSAHPAA